MLNQGETVVLVLAKKKGAEEWSLFRYLGVKCKLKLLNVSSECPPTGRRQPDRSPMN